MILTVKPKQALLAIPGYNFLSGNRFEMSKFKKNPKMIATETTKDMGEIILDALGVLCGRKIYFVNHNTRLHRFHERL